MTRPANAVLNFHGAIEKNRTVYALEHSYGYYAFFGLYEMFDRAGQRLQTGRDANGRSHVSLLPFLLLMLRQCMNAFEALSSCRSYEAWVSLRPAIESALIMGKWVDDPDNAAIWGDRVGRKTEYIKTFSGKGLISTSLPRAVEIKEVLDRLNDEFVHANEPYYDRHVSAEPLKKENVFLRVDYFDTDEEVQTHTLAFLHLVAVLVDSVDSMLAKILPTTGEHRPNAPRLAVELASRASRLRSSGAVPERVLRELGLWFKPTA